jgi:hypothetical protein
VQPPSLKQLCRLCFRWIQPKGNSACHHKSIIT